MSEFLDKSGASAYLAHDAVHVFSKGRVGMGKTDVSLVASLNRAQADLLPHLGAALRIALTRFIKEIHPDELNSTCTDSLETVLGLSNQEVNKALRGMGSAYIGFGAAYPCFFVGGWITGARGSGSPLLEEDIVLPVDVSDEELGRVMLDVLERSLAATLELAVVPPKPKRTRAKKAASE
ncbi:MAG: hypothetical protein ACK5PG_04400 [Lysobacterales bacterium]